VIERLLRAGRLLEIGLAPLKGQEIGRDFGDYVLERSVNGEQIRNRRIRSGQPTVFWTQTVQIQIWGMFSHRGFASR
jgi:hypothetical protein